MSLPTPEIDAALLAHWRRVRRALDRRLRAWPAEVRDDAAADDFLRELERARRTGEPPHPAAWTFGALRQVEAVARPFESARGRTARPQALGEMLLDRALLAPDDYIAEAVAQVPDFDLALDMVQEAERAAALRAEARRADRRARRRRARVARAEARAAAAPTPEEVAAAVAALAELRPVDIAAGLGVSQACASQWRSGARPLPAGRARQVLALVAGRPRGAP